MASNLSNYMFHDYLMSKAKLDTYLHQGSTSHCNLKQIGNDVERHFHVEKSVLA